MIVILYAVPDVICCLLKYGTGNKGSKGYEHKTLITDQQRFYCVISGNSDVTVHVIAVKGTFRELQRDF